MRGDLWSWGTGVSALLFVLGLVWIETLMGYGQKCSVCGRNLEALRRSATGAAGEPECRFCSWGIFLLRPRDL